MNAQPQGHPQEQSTHAGATQEMVVLSRELKIKEGQLAKMKAALSHKDAELADLKARNVKIDTQYEAALRKHDRDLERLGEEMDAQEEEIKLHERLIEK